MLLVVELAEVEGLLCLKDGSSKEAQLEAESGNLSHLMTFAALAKVTSLIDFRRGIVLQIHG